MKTALRLLLLSSFFLALAPSSAFAAFSLEQSQSANEVLSGQSFEVYARVTNQGGAADAPIVCGINRNNLVEGISFRAASGAGGSSVPGYPADCLRFPALAPGQAELFILTARVLPEVAPGETVSFNYEAGDVVGSGYVIAGNGLAVSVSAPPQRPAGSKLRATVTTSNSHPTQIYKRTTICARANGKGTTFVSATEPTEKRGAYICLKHRITFYPNQSKAVAFVWRLAKSTSPTITIAGKALSDTPAFVTYGAAQTLIPDGYRPS